jgi:hypothetical protein
MPPVRSVKNQYPGINAHLNSWLQAKAGWNSFHTNHIADLTRLMRAQLLPIGYDADTEQSLQIRRFGDEERTPQSDITIYNTQTDPRRSQLSPPAQIGNAGELVISMPELVRHDETELAYYWSVAIYETPEQGEPVAWVELLSPSNKPGGRDHESYRQKRLNVLQSGIVFVEIDYLHLQPPTFESLDSYVPRRRSQSPDGGAYPYRISVIDPRPVFFEGQGHFWQFRIDQPIPTVKIPLSGSDSFDFDFGAAYRKTFEEMLYGQQVDYLKLPESFERYSSNDQAQIVARMLAVIDAATKGADLEKTSLIVEPITLETGLARLEQLQQTHAGAE